jgi:hypothetical protein
MGCEPTARVEVLNTAVPLVTLPVPIDVPLSLNVTVPVAVPGVTVAVKVTEVPAISGFELELNVVVEFTLFTVWVNVEEVLELSLLSPPYAAVMGWEDTDKVEVLNVAVPLLSVPVPMDVPLSLNVTVPVAVPGVTVAVKVTEVP